MKPHWQILCDTFLFTIQAVNVHKTCSMKIDKIIVIKLKCAKEEMKIKDSP